MKKVVSKLNRALSVLLAVAMIVGMAPDMNLTAYAATDDATAVVNDSTPADGDAEEPVQGSSEANTEEKDKESTPTSDEAKPDAASVDNMAGEEGKDESKTETPSEPKEEEPQTPAEEEEDVPETIPADLLPSVMSDGLDEPTNDQAQPVVEDPVLDGEAAQKAITTSGDTNAFTFAPVAETGNISSGNIIEDVSKEAKFTVKAKPGYSITKVVLKKGDAVVDNCDPMAAAADGFTYTIPAETITDATNDQLKVEVTTGVNSAIEFPTQTNFTISNESNLTTDKSKIADITKDVTFKVVPGDGYDVAVTYKIGDDGAETTLPGTDNVYTIPKNVFTSVADNTHKVVVGVTATAKVYTVSVAVPDYSQTPEGQGLGISFVKAVSNTSDMTALDYKAIGVTGCVVNNDTKTVDVTYGEALFVKVEKTEQTTGKVILSNDEQATVTDSDTTNTVYFKVVPSANTAITVAEVSQNCTIHFEKNDDAFFEEVKIKVGDDGTLENLPKTAELDVPKGSKITIQVKTKESEDIAMVDVLADLGGEEPEVVSPEDGFTGDTKYTVTAGTYVIDNIGEEETATVLLNAAPMYEIQFVKKTGETESAVDDDMVTYSDSVATAATGADYSAAGGAKTYYRAGKLCFKVTATDGNKVKSVKVGDTVLKADKNAVYSTEISANTKIVIEEYAKHDVTVNTTAAEGATVKWTLDSTQAVTEWTTYETKIGDIGEGETVYLYIAPKTEAGKEYKITKVVADGKVITPYKDKEYYKFVVGTSTNPSVVVTQEESGQKRTLKFDTLPDGASVTSSSVNGEPITVDSTHLTFADIAAGSECKFKVSAGTDKVVKSVKAGEDTLVPDSNDFYHVIVAGADVTVTIETEAAKKVTIAYEAESGISKVSYSVGDAAVEDAKDVTKPLPTNKTIGNLKTGDVVTIKVETNPGVAVTEVSNKTSVINKDAGLYSFTIADANIDSEITTETSFKVNFKTDVEGVNPTVKHIVKNAGDDAPTNTSEFTGTSTSIVESDEKDVYFIVEGVTGTEDYEVATDDTVDINGATKQHKDSVKDGDGEDAPFVHYYKLTIGGEQQDAYKEATVTVHLDKVYTITFAKDGNAAEDVEICTVDKSNKVPLTGNTAKVKANEEYTFAVREKKEQPTDPDTIKLKKVEFKYKAAGKRSYTTEDKTLGTDQFTITPVDGENIVTIKVDTIRNAQLKFDTKDTSRRGTVKPIKVATDTKHFADGSETTPISVTIPDLSDAITAIEGKSVYAKIEANDFYVIDKVTLKGKNAKNEDVEIPLTIGNDGICEIPIEGDLTPASGDTLVLKPEILIYTKADAANMSELDFGANTDSEGKKEVKVTVTAGEDGFVEYGADGKWYTNAATATFKVDAVRGYEVTGIKIDGKVPSVLTNDALKTINAPDSTDNDIVFTIPGSLHDSPEAPAKPTYESVKVEITTQPVAIDTEQPVTFNLVGDAENKDIVTLAFKNDDKEYAGDVERKIEAGATDFRFDVIVRGPYKPTVKNYNKGNIELEPEATTDVSADKKIYTYRLVAAQVAAGEARYDITVEKDEKILTLTFDPEYITNQEVFKRVEGENIPTGKPDYGKLNGNTKLGYHFVKGDEAVVIVNVLDGYKLENDKFELVDEETNQYKYYISALADDEEVILTTAAVTKFDVVRVVGQDETKALEYVAKSDAYRASKLETLLITGTKAGEKFEFTKGEFGGVTVDEKGKPEVKSDKSGVLFNIPEAAAGKTITISATYKDGEEEKSVSYKLVVNKDIKKLDVKGVKDGVVSQYMATKATYGLKLSGSTDYSALRVEVENPATGEVAKAEIKPDKKTLVIDTAAVAGSAKVKIFAYGVKDAEGKDKPVVEFTVNSVKPDLKVNKVSLVAALHNGFVIKPTSAKPVEDYNSKLVEGMDIRLAYKVVAVKPAGSKYEVQQDGYFFDKTAKVASEELSVGFTVPKNSEGVEEIEEPAEYTLKTSLALVKKDGNKYTVLAEGDAVESKFTTRNPYFEDKLKLTKRTTTIFSGQRDIAVAVPKFGKNTTYQGLYNCEVEVYKANGELDDNFEPEYYENGEIRSYRSDVYAYYDTEDNEIKVTVERGLPKGSYTIKVIPFADETHTFMYAAPASIKINVVQGIYDIKTDNALQGEQVDIYKIAGKAASFKLDVVYNGGFANRKPYKKAVKYEIIGADYEKDPTFDDYEVTKKGKTVTTNLVTCKNGKITVDKKYVVKPDPKDNQFRVKVTADDYEGNKEVGYSAVFTITGDKAEMGDVYLARYNKGVYDVVTDTPLTTDVLNDLEVIVTKAGVAAKSYYEADDLLKDSLYSLKVSNKKLGIYDNSWNKNGERFTRFSRDCASYIAASHLIGKNIKITATSTDGSKVTKSKTFTTAYNQGVLTGKVDVEHDGDVEQQGARHEDKIVGIVETNGEFHYSAATLDNYLAFRVAADDVLLADKESATYAGETGTATYNYKVSVSGGKILRSSQNLGVYDIVPTAQKTVVKLQDKSSKSTKTYTFVNDAFVKGKAPSVTVKTEKMYANYTGNKNITVSVGKTDCDYAYFSIDSVDYQKAIDAGNGRAATYEKIRDIFYNTDDDDYRWRLSTAFGGRWDNNGKKSKTVTITGNVVAGNYKLNVVFGRVDGNTGAFIPETSKKTVTIKVKNATSFKPAKSYTLDPSVGFVTLSGKPAELSGTAYAGQDIKNANIGGQPNNFVDYFQLVGTKLVLRPKLDKEGKETTELWTADELAAILKANKNAFTGYVSYEDFKTGNTEWAQIKVNVKAAKYTATDINTFAGEKNASGWTEISKGWEDFDIKYAYAESSDGIAFANIVDDDNKPTDDIRYEINYNNKEDIRLTTTSVPAKGKYKVNLYIIDAASSAATVKFKDNENPPTAADIKKYGALVTLKFNVLDPNAKKKLTVLSKNIVFDEFDYRTDALSWIVGDDQGSDYPYWHDGSKHVTSYELADGAVVDKITVAEGTPDYIKVEQCTKKEGNETSYPKRLKVTIDKAKFKAANDAAKRPILGKKISVKFDVSFKNGLAAESYKVNVTLPKTIQTYADALEAVKAGYETALAGLNLNRLGVYENEEALIAETVRGLSHYESGLRVTASRQSYKPATNTEAGWYLATLLVENKDKDAKDAETILRDVRISVPVKDKTQSLDEAEKAVNIALANYKKKHVDSNNKVVTNDITRDDILAIAKAVVTNPNIEVRYAIMDGFELVPAEEGQDGSLGVKILLSRSIVDRRVCEFSDYDDTNDTFDNVGDPLTILGFDDFDGALTKISGVIGANSNRSEFNKAKVKEDVLAAIQTSYNNPEITIAFKAFDGEDAETKNFDITQAGVDTPGSYKGTLVVSKPGKLDEEIEITNGVLPALDTASEVKGKIEAAFADYKTGANDKFFTNSTNAADVLAIAKAADDNSEGFTISIKPDTTEPEFKGFDLTAADVQQRGSINVTFEIKDNQGTVLDEAVASGLLIERLPQSITEAEAAAKEALADATFLKGLTSRTSASDIETQIMKKVAVGVYTASVTISENTAKVDAAGEITAKVTIDTVSGVKDRIVFNTKLAVPAPTTETPVTP